MGLAVALVTDQCLTLALSLAGSGTAEGLAGAHLQVPGPGWARVLLVPVPVAVLLVVATGAGELMARAAGRLLGPSAGERLAELEQRTEQLLERNNIARELHDTLGHALTLAVVQAAAARTAGDQAFTDRALQAIEETGRTALEDLDRVLLVLREKGQPPGTRPALQEAARLLDSARSSGAQVDARVTGALEHLPGPVSREAYRMLQEALTNVLRHAGSVPVGVRIAVEPARLRLEVRNPLPARAAEAATGGGSGLRGIRERAALLGGEACVGRHGDHWLLRVELPLR
ncbi:hypothetical protein SCWH03_06760 [Streptomyces pacificus]|uniref:histidine kinase n=1 Tax=Streptomyces pacificus TaxID=2705029 RepID=A0A6A0ANM6_9ACTN|nr:hypothetical protein SCWH03_06760 [Streptomyces pacificus]